ncbi:MAG TPA: ATP-binding protein, partial [Terriglobales bacterium]|nr:ATP-binding protein [Terriglobales bacterium]
MAGDSEALDRHLTDERIRNADRINLVRLAGLSAFFALSLGFGVLAGRPEWRGNLALYAAYWAAAVAVAIVTRRVPRLGACAGLAITLVDVPMVFFLQSAALASSPSPSGVAGFTVGVYVLFVLLATLALRDRLIWATAAVGAAFEVALQYQAGVRLGGMAATVILLGAAAAACAYARRRLVELVERVERDLARQREQEAALRRAEGLASLGTLAASVAHEINTPLTYVVTNLALIAERLSPAGGGADIERRLDAARAGCARLGQGFVEQLPSAQRHELNNARFVIQYALDRLAEALRAPAPGPAPRADRASVARLVEQARDGADRVRTIVRDLRALSRADDTPPGPVDVTRVVEASINLVSSEVLTRARLCTERGAVPIVAATEARLGQVLVNLLVNAAQAIPDGTPDANEIRVVTGTDAAGRAVIEVRDTGPGIPDEIRARLFDPFFTTKPVGQGTGLGLSICDEIVRGFGGELTAESVVGRGTTFRVALPAMTFVPAPAVAPAAPAVAVSRARILVVDDDAGIGEAVRESLATDHDVIALTRAADALDLVRRGERFAL